MTPEEIVGFWFGSNPDDVAAAEERSALWWDKDPAVDRALGERFGGWIERAAAGELDAWAATPRGRLALVLLLDQLPRNVFRDTPRAFAHDARALAHCLRALATRADRALRPIERVFLYLPLEHSEAPLHQDRSVALYAALLDEVPPAWRPAFEAYHRYALRHREIVARFGRFPHRNALLGRRSTPEELAFLREPDSAF